MEEALGFSQESSTIEFDLLLHFSTLLAVIIYFRKRLSSLLLSVFRAGSPDEKKMITFLIVGTIPIVIIGFLFKDKVEVISEDPILVCTFLSITGLILFLPSFIKKSIGNKEVTVGHSFIIGIAQAIALLPGISRSGSTITMGMLLGIPAKRCAEFSFLLGIPAICGAIVLKMKEISSLKADLLIVYSTGMIAAFLTGLIAIFCVLNLIAKGKFKYFGFYCLLIGITGLIYFTSS
jgi:undecaprenyl-diphosphatase